MLPRGLRLAWRELLLLRLLLEGRRVRQRLPPLHQKLNRLLARLLLL